MGHGQVQPVLSVYVAVYRSCRLHCGIYHKHVHQYVSVLCLCYPLPGSAVHALFLHSYKGKWLAIIDAVYYLYMFIVGGWYIRAAILACAVALAIFFSGDVIESIKRAKRRADWKRNFK